MSECRGAAAAEGAGGRRGPWRRCRGTARQGLRGRRGGRSGARRRGGSCRRRGRRRSGGRRRADGFRRAGAQGGETRSCQKQTAEDPPAGAGTDGCRRLRMFGGPVVAHLCYDLAQQHAADGVVGILGQHKLRAAAGGQHVLLKVRFVDALPDFAGRLFRFGVRERCVTVEVGLRLGERRGPQFAEAVHVPLLDVGRFGINIDGKIEEVTQGQALPAVMPRPGRRQDVQSLDDQHVGAAHHHFLPGDDVIGHMGVPGRADFLGAALDFAHEPEQRAAVVGLRESLALQELAPLEFRQRVQEAVRGDEFNVGGPGPAAEHLAKHAGDGRLAHGHRTGDADHKRGALGLLAQEGGGCRVELAGRLDVQVQQPGQREVDLADLLHVERIAEAAETEYVLLVEGLLHLGSQPGPGLPVQLHERGAAVAVRFIALQSHPRDSALRRA